MPNTHALWIAMLSWWSGSTYALQPMTDEQLSETRGQALFYTNYIAPNTGTTSTTDDFGFYRLGIEGRVELNANIRKLQLGCGGINGAAGCDIDIDYLGLSGASETADGRAGSSALITNPFFEIAIKNPNNASTREIAGIRFSAQQVAGLMTFGTENSTTENGINTFSGYFQTQTATGTATTAPRNMTFADTGQTINGRIRGTLFFVPTTLSYSSNNYNLALQSATVPFTLTPETLNGKRQTAISLTGQGNVGQINFAGPLTANVGGFNLNKNVTGNITGLVADISVNQDLGFFHKLAVNNPASLSVQKENILWPGAAVNAQTGWWLAFEDQVDIGNVTPSSQVAITNAVLQQVTPVISQYLTDNPTPCGDLLFGCALNPNLPVGNINLSASPGRFLDFPLANLQLAAQSFAPNCYGGSGLTFC